MSHTTEVPTHQGEPASTLARSGARHVLLVEDNEIDAEIFRALIRRMPEGNWEFHWAANFEEGLTMLDALPLDIVLVDYWLGDDNGADFIHRAREAGNALPMVVVTAIADPANDLRVFLAGAAAYVPKDTLTSEVLERTIRYALRDPRMPTPRFSDSCSLSGFACICVDCRRLRDSQERWRSGEEFLAAEPAVVLSHALCPQCFAARMEHMPPS